MMNIHDQPVERAQVTIRSNKVTYLPGVYENPVDQLSKQINYVNRLPYPVGVLTYLNEIVIVGSTKNIEVSRLHSHNCFSIVETRKWRKGYVKFNTSDQSSEHDLISPEDEDNYFNILAETTAEIEKGAFTGERLTVEIITEVHRDNLNELITPMYIKEANIVLFNPNIGLPSGFKHPLSNTNRHFSQLDAVLASRGEDIPPEDELPSMLFMAYGVYHGDPVKPLYAFIADNLFEIPIRTNDASSEEGVYILYKGVCNNSKNSNKLKRGKVIKHYSFDEAEEELGFYTNKLDAMNHNEKQLSEHKIKLQAMQQELNEMKHQYDLERLKYEKELKKMSQVYSEMDMKVKHEYHRSSYARKSFYEMLTWVPKITTVLAALSAGAWTYIHRKE